MKDSITEMLDVTAWIIGGLFVGLTVLGSYNFYQEYQNSSVPSLSITPLKEDEIQPEKHENTFQPLSEFHLVRKHSPQETTEKNEESGQNVESREGPRSEDTADTELPVTELPYRLTGTTTGAIGYQTATVHQRNGNQSRIMTSSQNWNEFKVISIAEDYIVIQNLETNSRERMPLVEKKNN